MANANNQRPSRRLLLRIAAGGAFAAGIAGGFLAEAIIAKRRYPDCESAGAELTVLIDEDLTPGRIRRELIRAWRDDVTLIEMPSKTDLIRTELAALGEAGGCAYDVVNLDIAWTEEVVRTGYFREILDPPAGLLDFALAAGKVDGRQYTVPFVTDAALLYYRADLLKGQPLPRTLAEAIDVGRPLGRQQKTDVAAYVGQFANYEGLTVNALEAIWSAGGDELDFGNRVTRTALTQLVEWVRDSTILVETDEQSSVDAFREGKAVFLRNWPFAYHQLYDAPALRGKLGVVALPWRSVLGGHNLGIAGATSNDRYEAAAALISYLTSAASQDDLFTLGGNPPVRESSYRQRDCTQASVASNRISTPGCEQLNRIAPELRKSLTRSKARPRAEWYSAYSRVVRSHLYPALAKVSELNFDRLQRDVDAVVR
jgi:multiple sugar transport system substrate-binding protein